MRKERSEWEKMDQNVWIRKRDEKEERMMSNNWFEKGLRIRKRNDEKRNKKKEHWEKERWWDWEKKDEDNKQ